MIEVCKLRKSFGSVTAVANASFTAEDGRITGLLGPNGAGKSTTLRMLYTALRPDQGHALIGGKDIVKESSAVRRQIGVLPHGSALYPLLTAR
ncbi:MAG: ATP-binding cassette domain-containing protein, partial [Myxococcota bacterium]